MTGSERDFDRIARAWLDLGSNEAPDRAVDAVLQAIETTPQVRRPFRWPIWRSTTMTRLPLLALLAGLIILAVGAVLMSGGGPGPVPVASPPPSTAASPSSAAYSEPLPLPDALVGGWVGAQRDEGNVTRDTTVITFGALDDDPDAPDFAVEIPRSAPSMPSDAVEIEPGVIRITSTAASAECQSGDAGTYRWSVSADGQWLTATLIDDACPSRAVTLPGDWQRSLAHDSCGGSGISTAFEPSFTFSLSATTWLGRGNNEPDTLAVDSGDADHDATFKVWKQLDGFADPCDIDKGRRPLLDMDALVGYFEDDPRFDVVRREEYEIDGHPAVELEFVVGAGLEPPCWTLDGDQNDLSGVLTWVPNGTTGFWNTDIGGRDALVITEVGGTTLAFEALTFEGDVLSVDRDTLSTVRFLDALPGPPAS